MNMDQVPRDFAPGPTDCDAGFGLVGDGDGDLGKKPPVSGAKIVLFENPFFRSICRR
jgi:hypothetical protein